jgi:hypothetical protein
MKSDREWDELLSTAPVIPFNGHLSRAVVQLGFKNYLFTSARRNRCNPDGISCLYMAEDRDTALCEYDKYFTDDGDRQPFVIFTGKLVAQAILNLGDRKTADHFGLADKDFSQAFRVIKEETVLEQLGRAVSRQRKVCAIRFPSEARRLKFAVGFNLAIFKEALSSPDSLYISGERGKILEQWP